MPKRLALLAITIVNALLVVVACYASLRLFDVFFRHEPNPATVIWSAHIAMFWRIGIGSYAAALVAPVVWLIAKRDMDGTLRMTQRALGFVAALATLQGIFFP